MKEDEGQMQETGWPRRCASRNDKRDEVSKEWAAKAAPTQWFG